MSDLPANTAYAATTRIRAGAFVALLAMLLLQLTGATHQYSHTLDELSSSCEVCLQLDRDDTAPERAVVAAVPAPLAEMALAVSSRVVDSQPHRLYQSRAPPRI